MNHNKTNLVMTAAALVGLLSLAITPVAFAQTAPNTVASSRDGTTSKGDNFGGLPKADKTKVQERIAELKTEAKTELTEQRKGKEVRTPELRQKACEQRKVSIDNKVAAFSKSADNILTRFNTVYTRVKTFKTDKKLDVANYDALITAANAKQAAATEAVAALKTLSGDFTCTSTDPAQSLAAIKAATASARNALKEYRTAIKDIVTALAQTEKQSNHKTPAPTPTPTPTPVKPTPVKPTPIKPTPVKPTVPNPAIKEQQ